jgi:hypothetical protein
MSSTSMMSTSGVTLMSALMPPFPPPMLIAMTVLLNGDAPGRHVSRQPLDQAARERCRSRPPD